MKRLIEYKYEKPISIVIDGKKVKKIVKIPSIDPSWDNVEMFSKIDNINLYVNDRYICSFSTNDVNTNFIHYVTKIQLMFYYTTKRYYAKIYVEV